MHGNRQHAGEALKARTYFTGKPCLRGHVAPRRAHNGVCIECERERDRKRDRIRRQNGKKRWDKAQAAAWRAKNPDYSRKWRARNRDKVRAYLRASRERHKTRSASH
jgi:hypothetical protein